MCTVRSLLWRSQLNITPLHCSCYSVCVLLLCEHCSACGSLETEYYCFKILEICKLNLNKIVRKFLDQFLDNVYWKSCQYFSSAPAFWFWPHTQNQHLSWLSPPAHARGSTPWPHEGIMEGPWNPPKFFSRPACSVCSLREHRRKIGSCLKWVFAGNQWRFSNTARNITCNFRDRRSIFLSLLFTSIKCPSLFIMDNAWV